MGKGCHFCFRCLKFLTVQSNTIVIHVLHVLCMWIRIKKILKVYNKSITMGGGGAVDTETAILA